MRVRDGATPASRPAGAGRQRRGQAEPPPAGQGLYDQLKTQLQASPRDGQAIGATLTSLGSMTTQAGGGDAALGKLGAALSKGGQALTGRKA